MVTAPAQAFPAGSRGAARVPRRGKSRTFRPNYLSFAGSYQCNLSCAHCHQDNWGRKLGPETISQGHGNPYPVYRLEWQTLGSLKRRLRNCLVGIRAEPLAWDAPELVSLELYLMERARGMTMEGVGVRP